MINLSLGGERVRDPDPAGDRDGDAQGDARRRRSRERRRGRKPAHLSGEPAACAHGRGDRRAEPAWRRSRAAPASSTSPRPGQDIIGRLRARPQLGSEDGTSFASPLVSGAAAWVWTRAAGARREPAVRGDAPLGHGHRRAGPRRRDRLRPAQRPCRAHLPGPGAATRSSRTTISTTSSRAGCTTTASRPLTSRAKPSTTLTARLAVVEDPRDLYPVFVPRTARITVKTTPPPPSISGSGPRDDERAGRARQGQARPRHDDRGRSRRITYTNAGARRRSTWR